MSFNFNPVNKNNAPAEQTPSHNNEAGMAKVSIRVDADCFLLCDGEYMGDIEIVANKITKVQLPIGQHLLEFMDKENPDIKVERVVDFPNEVKSYLVLVDGLEEAIAEAKEKKQILLAASKAKADNKAEVKVEAKAEAERKTKAGSGEGFETYESTSTSGVTSDDFSTDSELDDDMSDSSVNVIINPNLDIKKQLQVYYDYVFCLNSDGLYKIRKNDRYGLANSVGTVVAAPKYDHIYRKDSKAGFIKVLQNNLFGILNSKGAVIFEPQFKYIYRIDDDSGLMKVQKDDKFGLINSMTMELVTPCIYTWIYSLDGGLYKVEQGEKTGYLNKDGSVLKAVE